MFLPKAYPELAFLLFAALAHDGVGRVSELQVAKTLSTSRLDSWHVHS